MYVKHYSEQSSPKENTKEPSGNFVTSLELLNDEPLSCTQRSSNVWATPSSNVDKNQVSDVSQVKPTFSQRCFEMLYRIISKMLLWKRSSNITVNEVCSEKERSSSTKNLYIPVCNTSRIAHFSFTSELHYRMPLRHCGQQSSFTEKPKQVSEQIVTSCMYHVINYTFEVQVGVAFRNVSEKLQWTN